MSFFFWAHPVYCIKSTFGSNYKYLPCKYGISQDDWYTNLSQLFKKVNMKCHEEMRSTEMQLRL